MDALVIIVGSILIIMGVFIVARRKDRGKVGLVDQSDKAVHSPHPEMRWLETVRERFSAGAKTKTHEATAKLSEAIGKSLTAHEINKEIPHRARRESEREEIDHENTLRAGVANLKLIEEASKVGLTPEYLVLANTEDLASRRRTDEEDRMAAIRVKEHEEKARVDLENRWLEMEQDLKAGMIYKQRQFQYLQMHRQYIEGLYEHQRLLEATGERKQELKLLRSHITVMTKSFHERAKLLTAGNEEAAEETFEDTEE